MNRYVSLIKTNFKILLAIVLISGAGLWWLYSPSSLSPVIRAAIPEVIVKQVSVGNAIENFEALGTVKAVESLIVSPKIAGYIQTIHAQAGEIVHAGAPIITLRAEERKADTASFAAQLAQAQAKRDDAARQLARGELLSKQGVLALATRDTLRANAQAAEQAVAALTAQKQMAEVRLEDTILRAPFEGIVGITDEQVGTYVTPGLKLTTLTRSDTMKVEIALPERAVPFLKLGMTGSVTSMNQPDQTIAGTVQEIDSEVNVATRQVRLNLIIPNNTHNFTQGMSVIAHVETAIRDKALLIPEEAVIGDGLRQFAFIVDKDGVVNRKLIKTGVRTKGIVEVLEGLTANDSVVIEGHQKIRHGQKVKVTPKT